ncbi:hypothetical protein V5799_031509, partial [Amblyomma americanum]
MGQVAALYVVAFCYATAVVAKLADPGGPHQLHYDVADSFKVFENFPFSVAIGDSDHDGVLECIAANRTEIDPAAQTATFVWLFQETDYSPKRDVPFYVKVGDEPGTLTFTVANDPTLREGRYYYTDYENCVVLDMEYHGH